MPDPVGGATVRARFCDDLGVHGFGWVVDESLRRASHVLVAEGKVWLVDPVDWPDAIERALSLGEPAGVLQLLDRHSRDCDALARRLGVPRLVAPDSVPGGPFRCVPVVRRRFWHESALWWPAARTLVLADALGTTSFATGGNAPLGVHVLLRLTPPRQLGRYAPEHVLVGHGKGLHGTGAASALQHALADSRRGLPRILLRLPLAARGR